MSRPRVGVIGVGHLGKQHARIYRQANQYLLADNHTASGTWLNDERIAGPTPLRSGDRIRIGRNILLFRERSRRNAEPSRLP